MTVTPSTQVINGWLELNQNFAKSSTIEFRAEPAVRPGSSLGGELEEWAILSSLLKFLEFEVKRFLEQLRTTVPRRLGGFLHLPILVLKSTPSQACVDLRHPSAVFFKKPSRSGGTTAPLQLIICRGLLVPPSQEEEDSSGKLLRQGGRRIKEAKSVCGFCIQHLRPDFLSLHLIGCKVRTGKYV